MSSTVLTSISARTLGQRNWELVLAERKALKMQKKAEAARVQVAVIRKRVREEMTDSSAAQPALAAPATKRTSTKAFCALDPHHGLAVLQRIDLSTAMQSVEWKQLGVVSRKYGVITLAEALSTGEAPLCKSVSAAAMKAAACVRYVFDVACELVANEEDGKEGVEAQNGLLWHSPQMMIGANRQTRGSGVVTNSDAAQALLEKALAVAKLRLSERAEAIDRYEAAVNTTAAAAAVVRAGGGAQSP